MNPYEVLGVPQNATPQEIKSAFHKLAHLHHPDKTGGNAEKFKKISAAYSLVKDTPQPASHPSNAARPSVTVVYTYHNDAGFWADDIFTQQKAQQDAIDRMFEQMKAQRQWWGTTGTS